MPPGVYDTGIAGSVKVMAGDLLLQEEAERQADEGSHSSWSWW